jgi:hypothetical protein
MVLLLLLLTCSGADFMSLTYTLAWAWYPGSLLQRLRCGSGVSAALVPRTAPTTSCHPKPPILTLGT